MNRHVPLTRRAAVAVTTLALAASYPLGPDLRGRWKVEVFTLAGNEPAQLLLAREFEVL